MQKVLVPYQQDLITNYEVKNFKEEPIINRRFINYINSSKDLIAFTIPYDEKYLDYIKDTEEEVSVLIPGGENIGKFPERDNFERSLLRDK